MANLLDTLRIGGNALSAHQVAAQVTGTNISSASTPGYHRQDALYISQVGLGGIRDVQVSRAASRFLDAQINQQQSQFAYQNERTTNLELIMGAVGSMDDASISSAMNEFFGSWRNVNVAPTDATTRRDLLAKTDIFCSRFNQASANLSSARALADADVVSSLTTVNDALTTVAALNTAIVQTEAAGQPSASLRDQQDGQIRILAQLIGATTQLDANNSTTVQLAGISLVSGGTAFRLSAEADAGSGMHGIVVENTTQGRVDSLMRGGSIGAKIAVRDQDIPQTQTTLDQVAFDFATAVNAVHSTGYGLDGATGRDLFRVPPTATTAAAFLAVDATVVDAPDHLAAAQGATGVNGDSSNALAIIDLESSKICASNTLTADSALANLVAGSGEAVSLATVNRDQAQRHLSQIEALYEEQNGVSINEQLLQLSRIQNAYQASAKLISVVERMLETLQQI